MRTFIFCFLLLCSLKGFAEPYCYTIVEHPYRFSTSFEMKGKKGFEGRSIKNSFALRTAYDLYDSMGLYQGRGAVRILSVGSLFAWAKNIDVFDALDQPIGLIQGQALTTASAKYLFYNQANQVCAVAYLDYSCSGFVVVSADGKKTLADLRRNFVEGVNDHWEVTVFSPEQIDLRLLKIFSIFAIDHQEYFKEDR